MCNVTYFLRLIRSCFLNKEMSSAVRSRTPLNVKFFPVARFSVVTTVGHDPGFSNGFNINTSPNRQMSSAAENRLLGICVAGTADEVEAAIARSKRRPEAARHGRSELHRWCCPRRQDSLPTTRPRRTTSGHAQFRRLDRPTDRRARIRSAKTPHSVLFHMCR